MRAAGTSAKKAVGAGPEPAPNPGPRRRFLWNLAGSVFVARAAGGLTAASSAFAQPDNAASASAPAPSGYTLAPWPAATTPPLNLTDLGGRPWSLSEQRGRLVLLNFWATWCEPCRAEMPALQRLATRIGAKRLSVVGVNYQEPPARIERFVAANALTFPIVLDRDGTATRAWTRRIFPTSVLVGPDGRARQVVVGEFDWNGAQATGLIEALLPR